MHYDALCAENDPNHAWLDTYEPVGQRFESSRARQKPTAITVVGFFRAIEAREALRKFPVQCMRFIFFCETCCDALHRSVQTPLGRAKSQLPFSLHS